VSDAIAAGEAAELEPLRALPLLLDELSGPSA
jgi:hypothetical protein